MRIVSWLPYLLNVLIVCSLLIIGPYFKVSHLISSKNAFFTGSMLTFPFVGWLAGPWAILGFILLRFFSSGLAPWLFFIRKLPGLVGGLYWSRATVFIRCCVPLCCIVLFIIHPVGRFAFLYSFYWFIPVILFFLKTRHPVAHAFGSTFVTHAVGSVIWLYTVPMTAKTWWALIPIVAIERTLIAGMLSGMIMTSTALSKWKPICSIAKKIQYVSFG